MAVAAENVNPPERPVSALHTCDCGSVYAEPPAFTRITVKEPPPDAAWLTVKVWPDTVTVPARAVPVFDATLNPMVPFPRPVEADVIVIHAALLAAVPGHPPLLVTAKTTLPPS